MFSSDTPETLNTQEALAPEVGSDLTAPEKDSFKTICRLAIPLMLSALSGNLMTLVDRMVLSHYSTAAMNGAAAAATIFAIFQFGAISIGSIAEVFVGQHNGAKQYKQIARPVWQMIWFGVFTIPLFAFLAIFGPGLLLPQEVFVEGKAYFSWLMVIGPLFAIHAALASFYIGRGKAYWVTITIVTLSLVNLFGDIILVFGKFGLPAMGAKGAAIATCLGEIVGLIMLLVPFLQAKNRHRFGVCHWQFDIKLFKKCLNIGFPSAMAHMVCISAWAVVMHILAKISFEHITLFTLCQTIYILLSFITDGTCKAVSTMSANLIGANKKAEIQLVFKAGIKLSFVLLLLLAIPLLWLPDCVINSFMAAPNAMEQSIQQMAINGCKWIWLAFWFESVVWVSIGILIAAGDTRFILVLSALITWTFGIIPYALILKFQIGPHWIPWLMPMLAFINMGVFWSRYQGGRWQQNAKLV